VADLFNALTGAARAPQGLAHGALVAPHQLLPALLERIEREAAHARAGRACGIAIKVNGLSDPDVVRALRRAASHGVPVDLVVRGICTLRPDPAHANLRIVSVVGRFLEHSRIYRFANDGAPEHFIGSSDLRPRNLRRRVELLVPVVDAEHRARLDGILAAYLEDGGRWVLGADGAYVRADDGGAIAQEVMATGLAPAAR
jgi:polyphosphate kinase